MKKQMRRQIPRRLSHAKVQARLQARAQARETRSSRGFDYSLPYRELDLRKHPELYRVGVGEQGVLLVEPYKSEILPHWKFATPKDAVTSSAAIYELFKSYERAEDFVGMDMARKFLQMGFTRSRRYANHRSGRKYDNDGSVAHFERDDEKAKSAEIFFAVWKRAEAELVYSDLKQMWKLAFG